MMLLCEAISFPPKTVPAQSARGLTPNHVWHSSEKAWKFHSSGSNMSCTPSVHMGITISVQAWGWGIEHILILTGKAAHWHTLCTDLFSMTTLRLGSRFAPGTSSRVHRGCWSPSEMCSDRRSFRCSCSRPSLLGRCRAAAGSQTQTNQSQDACTQPKKHNKIKSSLIKVYVWCSFKIKNLLHPSCLQD